MRSRNIANEMLAVAGPDTRKGGQTFKSIWGITRGSKLTRVTVMGYLDKMEPQHRWKSRNGSRNQQTCRWNCNDILRLLACGRHSQRLFSRKPAIRTSQDTPRETATLVLV